MRHAACLIILSLLLVFTKNYAQDKAAQVFNLNKLSKQDKPFPKPYEINTDTATFIALPYPNYQYLKETGKPLSLAEVIKLGHSFRYNSATLTKENTTDRTTFWLRAQIKNNLKYPIRITIAGDTKQMETYIADSTGVWKKYLTGYNVPWSEKTGLKRISSLLYTIPPKALITIYKRVVTDSYGTPVTNTIGIADNVIKREYIDNDKLSINNLSNAALFGFLIFAAIINVFFFYTVREKIYLLYAVLLLVIAVVNVDTQLVQLFFKDRPYLLDHESTASAGVLFASLMIILIFLQVPKNHPRWNKALLGVIIFTLLLATMKDRLPLFVLANKFFIVILFAGFLFIVIGLLTTIIVDLRAKRPAAKWLLLALLPMFLIIILTAVVSTITQEANSLLNFLQLISSVWPVIVLSWSLFDRFKMVLNENAMRAYDNERLAREKEEERNQLIAQQKEDLEIQVAQRTAELSTSLTNLKAAQTQLVQSEKMASLGELTAGIAHEIQNPLNFVNNFSEVNVELIDEMQAEIDKGDMDEVKAIANDIKANQQKISQHGRRADLIVKGMLQHSRTSTGERQETNINLLADEFLKLSYHGLRAKDKNFNAAMVTNFDDTLPKANIVQQDIGRVLLNLFNNAFYAVSEKKKTAGADYKPEVMVSTFAPPSGGLGISVKDNGNGIPDAIKEKIMQPFFTTKPTGEGTGLGLSLSYDMVVKGHGGKIDVDTKEGEFTEFIIHLPLQ